MVKGRVSVVLPSNGEKYLVRTIQDLIEKATGDLEIIPVLDGKWTDKPKDAPDEPNAWLPMPDDKRIKTIHFGQTKGMRASINAGCAAATGEFLCKCDAHVMVDPGWDEVIKRNYLQDNWILTTRRISLDPENWCEKVTGKAPVDQHFLSWAYEPDRVGAGLHGSVWVERAKARRHILLEPDLSWQGSFWVMCAKHWQRIGPMDESVAGTFCNEAQELGLKTQLGPWVGEIFVTKETKIAHWHKGKVGRGYFIDKRGMHRGAMNTIDYWMNDRWPLKKHTLRWLIEKWGGGGPGGVPSWPADLDYAFSDEAWEKSWAFSARPS